jgi:hypothetical protein
MPENKESKNDCKKKVGGFFKEYKYLILALCFVIGFWLLNWWFISSYYFPFTKTGNSSIESVEKDKQNFGEVMAKRGQFGDMFGAINSLFSGLAFAFLIYTALLQKKELELQREALTGQKTELANQVEQLSKQVTESQNIRDLQQKLVNLQTSLFSLQESEFKFKDEPRLSATASLDVQTRQITFHLIPYGADVFHINFDLERFSTRQKNHIQKEKSSPSYFKFNGERDEKIPDEISLTINYQTQSGKKLSQIARLVKTTDPSNYEIEFE